MDEKEKTEAFILKEIQKIWKTIAILSFSIFGSEIMIIGMLLGWW